MDLKIDKPELKIQSLIQSQNEKEDIKNIYSEINKETKVLEIKNKKDEEYSKLNENLKGHRKNYFDFREDIPKKVRNIKKRERQISQNKPYVRNRRFAVDLKYEEFNVFKAIGEIKEKEKQAVIEFYKSYLTAITQKENLLNQLAIIDNSQVKKNKSKRDTSSLTEKVNYLKENYSNSSIIDLSSNKSQIKIPKDLLNEDMQKLTKKKFKEWEEDAKYIENGIELQICNFTTSPWIYITGGHNPCYNKINWLKDNQKTLQQAVDFKALIKLLRDMNQTKVETFDITYEEDEDWSGLWPWQWKEKRFYFLFK